MPGFEPIAALPDGVVPLLEAARGLFGEPHVSWAGFAIRQDAAPYWLFRHMVEGTRFDLGPLLESECFRQHCPDLAVRVNENRTGNFQMLSPFALSASIADALVGGGALLRRLSVQDARSLAEACTEAVLCDHHDQLTVLASSTAWSDWFACDVWDRTWIVADSACGRVWLLCFTDAVRPRRR